MDAPDRLIGEIDRQVELLLCTRSVFPYMDISAVGSAEFATAPFYQKALGPVRLSYGSPLTDEDVKRHNGIGHWVNQNFIVRVCALLDEHGVFRPRIDHQLDGHEEVDMLRRLRNVFAHTGGEFDADNSEHVKLEQRLRKYYGLTRTPVSGRPVFPLSIDTVLVPLTQGCKRYVIARQAGGTSEPWQQDTDNEAVRARALARQRLANRLMYLLIIGALYLGAGWTGSIQYIVDRQFLSSTDYPEVSLPIIDVGAEWPLVYVTGVLIMSILTELRRLHSGLSPREADSRGGSWRTGT